MRALVFSLLIVSFFIPTQILANNGSNVKPLPFEAYGKLPTKSMVVISPEASRVAYRDTSTDIDFLIVIDLTKGEVVASANISEVNPNHMYFIDEDLLILVASDHKKLIGFRGRHEVSVAFSFNVKNNKVQQLLTAGSGIYEGQTELGNIVGVSDDKKYAYMPAWQTKGNYSLFKVNLKKRRKPKLAKKGTHDTVDFFIGEDGEILARERYDNKKDLHRVEAYQYGEWREIYRETAPIPTKGFYGLTPDRKHLVMKGFDPKSERWAYYKMALENGEISEPIFAREWHDVEHVLTDINRIVYGVKYSGFKPSYEFFSKKLNARIKGINKVLPNNGVSITDYTPDWEKIVLYMDGAASSGDYLLYNAGNLNLLVSERPDIPPEAVNSVRTVTVEARDGLKIPTLLTLPNNTQIRNLPAIMLPHGGPEAYDRIGFDWLAQYFASQGYLVVQPQFRGSSGFGEHHLQMGHGEWGRKMQDDLTDALKSLADEGVIDPKRVCIVGASYGGYAALAGAAFTPEQYKCVVSINGVSDIDRMLTKGKRKYGSDHWVVSYWEKIIAEGEVKEDHLAQISPINHIEKIVAPVLLVHGSYDQVVPIKQSEEMFDELEDADKKVTFVELEKGDHHLSKGENRMKALKAIDRFVKTHI